MKNDQWPFAHDERWKAGPLVVVETLPSGAKFRTRLGGEFAVVGPFFEGKRVRCVRQDGMRDSISARADVLPIEDWTPDG